MFERLLVPLDGSKNAEMVLPYAMEIATRLGAKIILVTVSESPAIGIDHLYRTYLESHLPDVRQCLKDWGAPKEAEVFGEVLLGKPASEILRYAKEGDIGLIIIASRGSSGEGPWLIGNIAAKVLRAADRPVLLIRTPAKDTAIKQKRLVKKMLVPLDGSKNAEAVLPYVEVLARALGAEVILLEVMEPVVSRVGGVGVSYSMREDEGIKKALTTYLASVGDQLQGRGVKTGSVVVFGFPAEQIIEYAEANDIDIIAMSSHGRSGIGRWVFGDVADKVLHAGNTPVMVVQAPKA